MEQKQQLQLHFACWHDELNWARMLFQIEITAALVGGSTQWNYVLAFINWYWFYRFDTYQKQRRFPLKLRFSICYAISIE